MFRSRTLAASLLAGVVLAVGVAEASSAATAPKRQFAAGTATSLPAVPTAPSRGIGVSIPLKHKPARGKTVAWLACALPSCTSFTPGFQSAVKALGWNLKVITYQSGNPAPAVDQAVTDHVNYMAMTGEPPVLFKQALALAHSKHIPLISANDTTPPDPATGLYTQFGNQSMFGNEGSQIGRWMVRKSGMKAHIAYVTIADYPILEAGFSYLQRTVSRYCPASCSTAQVPVTVTQLGAGQVPSVLVSYLQDHPNVNYIDFSFADLLAGVPQALQSAGLTSHVKLVGQALGAAPEVLAGLNDRSLSAWVAQPNLYEAWLMVDAMARLSEGMPLSQERQAAKEPTWVADSPSSTRFLNTRDGWDGPPGFQKDFQTLWHVGG